MSGIKSLFSMSCAATVIMCLYVAMAFLNLYKLMYPLSLMDTSSQFSSSVGTLWDEASSMRMKVYVSSQEKFRLEFLRYEFDAPQNEEGEIPSNSDVALLWKEDIREPSLAKSFLLCQSDVDDSACKNDASFKYASDWLGDVERSHGQYGAGGISAVLSSAGEGIESTSVLLSLYLALTKQVGRLFAAIGHKPKVDENEDQADSSSSSPTIVRISPSSPLWSALHRNETIHVHVVLTRNDQSDAFESYEEAAKSLMRSQRSHSLLLGHVNLIKYDIPHHISQPGRLLYRDVLYLVKRFVVRATDDSTPPPWDMAYAKPEDYNAYRQALTMKAEGSGYPYWKPQVSVKYVNEDVRYPAELAHISGMDLVQLSGKTPLHPTGYAMLPGLHVDEMGLTSEKYIPLNSTITSLPLRVSFDRNDAVDHSRHTTATAGGMSTARWRLLTHLSKSLESQRSLGFEQSDIDDVRRLIADTNVTLLTITMLASALHLLFEFLTFKNEVSFWSRNKDLTGLSVRALFLDMLSQVIILLYLVEQDSSLLMTIPTAAGCMIALWKCHKAAGFKFVRFDDTETNRDVSWWNVLPRMIGYELRATRLEIAVEKKDKQKKGNSVGTKTTDLKALTIETDKLATRTLGAALIPVVLVYTLYSFIWEEHTGWYSWLITSASSAVYALGFALMTPQLFLNHKLKSVSHLPWRVLIYKFLNTFIDDLFAFIIRMPTMARISCFRDDVVFIMCLYQRWLYPVDTSRPVEGGDGAASVDEEKKKK